MRTQNSTYQTILVTFVVALVSFIIGLMLSNVIRDIFFYSPAVAPLATRSVASPTLIRAHKAAEPLTKMAINIPLTAALVIPVDQAWASDEVAATVDEVSKIVPQGTYSDLIVFVLGSIPFLWATWEFWRRIAVGAPFGTGSDSVVFPSEVRGPCWRHTVSSPLWVSQLLSVVYSSTRPSHRPQHCPDFILK
mmetsp:Transcript_10907/g.19417  ORF Transcript_10907/g.19417 Transcript_10907/m.19417 type:complete len:192 (-) Transcript_10907:1471-2046(-)